MKELMMRREQPEFWKVGELAKKTGITIRALHHYDQIGLLKPTYHTESAHRLYSRGDLEKLQQIVAMRHFGFSLEQIRDFLDHPDTSPRRTLGNLRQNIQHQIDDLLELMKRLDAAEGALARGGNITSQALIELIEGITMLEKYMTPEQLKRSEEIEKSITPQQLEQAKVEWPPLIREVQAELDRGTPPSDPKVKALALRWNRLVNLKTGGDPGLSASHWEAFQKEPSFGAWVAKTMGSPGADVPKLIAYMRAANSYSTPTA